jgi:hypothetical protein
MPTREDVLREETFKDDEVDLERRVFYTLDHIKDLRVVRLEKAVALIVTHLHAKGVMSQEEIDEFLFLVVR